MIFAILKLKLFFNKLSPRYLAWIFIQFCVHLSTAALGSSAFLNQTVSARFISIQALCPRCRGNTQSKSNKSALRTWYFECISRVLEKQLIVSEMRMILLSVCMHLLHVYSTRSIIYLEWLFLFHFFFPLYLFPWPLSSLPARCEEAVNTRKYNM